MNYLRSVVSDVKLKYRVGRVVYDCVAKREQPEFTQYLTECVSIADGHPELVLTTLHEYLTFRLPENAYGGLLLLEQLVSLCNYGFHLALAKDYDIQDRIIQLAVKRGEGEAHRKAQRLARLTLLEYSRVFVDDRDLLRLSSLASSFEYRTRKSLMRCLNVQNRRVRFRDVDKSDIIPISPKESLGSTSGATSRAVAPLRLSSAPEVWPCHVCTYLNAPSATRCAACETLRSVDFASHRVATPNGTPRTTPKMAPQPSPPTPPPPPATAAAAVSPSPTSEDDAACRNNAELNEVQQLSRGGHRTDSPRCMDDDPLLPASAAATHVRPPSATFFHDPEHLGEATNTTATGAADASPSSFGETAAADEDGKRVERNQAEEPAMKMSADNKKVSSGAVDGGRIKMATPEDELPVDAPLDFIVESSSLPPSLPSY